LNHPSATPAKFFFDYGYSALTIHSQFLDEKFLKKCKILELNTKYCQKINNFET